VVRDARIAFGGIVGTAAAVSNAVWHATGVRVRGEHTRVRTGHPTAFFTPRDGHQ